MLPIVYLFKIDVFQEGEKGSQKSYTMISVYQWFIVKAIIPMASLASCVRIENNHTTLLVQANFCFCGVAPPPVLFDLYFLGGEGRGEAIFGWQVCSANPYRVLA